MTFIAIISNVLSLFLITFIGLDKRFTNKKRILNQTGWVVFIIAIVLYTTSIIIAASENAKLNNSLKLTYDKLMEMTDKFYKLDPNKITEKQVNSINVVPENNTNLTISNWGKGKFVNFREIISGTTKNVLNKIFVIVHPPGNSFWVQPSVFISDNGTWSTTAYFGNSDSDIGLEYEIMVVANPVDDFREGDVLDNWPKSEYYSQRITVIRK